jgi:hypothetical protein
MSVLVHAAVRRKGNATGAPHERNEEEVEPSLINEFNDLRYADHTCPRPAYHRTD